MFAAAKDTLLSLARFGRIDTLINNAGILIGKPFVEYTEKEYISIVTTNLGGFLWLTQKVAAEMLKKLVIMKGSSGARSSIAARCPNMPRALVKDNNRTTKASVQTGHQPGTNF